MAAARHLRNEKWKWMDLRQLSGNLISRVIRMTNQEVSEGNQMVIDEILVLHPIDVNREDEGMINTTMDITIRHPMEDHREVDRADPCMEPQTKKKHFPRYSTAFRYH